MLISQAPSLQLNNSDFKMSELSDVVSVMLEYKV